MESKARKHYEVSEKATERYIADGVKALGGIALKYYAPMQSGFPDRLLVLPFGIAVWVEVKSAGKTPRALQRVRIAALRELGHEVHVVSCREEAEALLVGLKNRLREITPDGNKAAEAPKAAPGGVSRRRRPTLTERTKRAARGDFSRKDKTESL